MRWSHCLRSLLTAALLLGAAAPAGALTLGADQPPPEEIPAEDRPAAEAAEEPVALEDAPLAPLHPYTSIIPGRKDLGLRASWRARVDVGGSEENPAAALELPLALTYGFDNGADARLEAPLRLRDGALSAGGYSGDLRLTVGLPVTDVWTVQPSIRFGVAGAMAPEPGRRIISGRVTSRVEWPVNDALRLSLGTTAEGYDAAPLGGVSDGLMDLTLRNRLGIALDTGFDVFGGDIGASAALTDIRRIGSDGLRRRAEVDIGLSTGGRLKLGASARLVREAEAAEAGVRARLFTRF
ncbi:hypothetical protein [Caenispirillum salinarum]|uniref:hypothetical protein n=1 Tax=Caenispirillum salinarum TaxID=859058 RepID=UPI003850FCA0